MKINIKKIICSLADACALIFVWKNVFDSNSPGIILDTLSAFVFTIVLIGRMLKVDTGSLKMTDPGSLVCTVLELTKKKDQEFVNSMFIAFAGIQAAYELPKAVKDTIMFAKAAVTATAPLAAAINAVQYLQSVAAAILFALAICDIFKMCRTFKAEAKARKQEQS